MVVALRLVLGSAALFALAGGVLVLVSFCVPGRAPQSAQFVVITLAVGVVLLGVSWLLFGIQRHAAHIAVMVHDRSDAASMALTGHVDRLLALLLTGSLLASGVLGIVAYAILARIDQGFAVFG